MNIGYACIALGVPGAGLRGCTLKNASEENLRSLIGQNIAALDRMIRYNIQNGIKLFRISSDIIPFGSHPVNKIEWWKEFEEELCTLGERIKAGGIRVSMHPGQYTVLNSPMPEVADNAVRDIEYHVKFLESLGMDEKSKIIVHIGGAYGNKKASAKRFADGFSRLPGSIRKHIAVENDEKCFNIADALGLGNSIGIPVVFDDLHNAVNPADSTVSNIRWIYECAATWKAADGRQKIHYSQQQAEGRPGAHSKTIYAAGFMELYQQIRELNPDVMLEVKDKNLSAVKCLNCMDDKLKIKALEEEWAKYKYAVLGKSGAVYSDIRNLLKQKEKPCAADFYAFIERALDIPEDRNSEKNAALHVWGYFKNAALSSEKRQFEELLNKYLGGEEKLERVKSFLHRMSFRYDFPYLRNSYYFTL